MSLRPDLQQLIQAAGDLKHVRPPAPCPPKGPFGFISDFSNNVVYELRMTPLAICAILTGPPFSNPQGIATDHHGNLYVANTGGNNVLRYAMPYTGAPFVMQDPGEYPVDVAVDPKGNVAVTNLESTSGGPGNIALYAVGSSVATGSASSPTFTSPRFAAFNSVGELFLDDVDLFNTGVVNVGAFYPNYVSFANGIATLTTANSIGFPGGVQINTAHKVAIDDQSGGFIYSYNSPSGLNLGSPATTTLATSSDPVGFAFNAGGNHTLSANAVSQAALYNKYPTGVLVSSLIFGGNSLPIGAGTVPTEQYSSEF